MNRKILLLVCYLICVGNSSSFAQPPLTGTSSGEIRQSLRKLSTLGCVMYIAAHPDDENTRLLSYLANERNLRTVYLSITRGDGGQNLIGKEQGEELGMIRTQELLMARKIDGAEQHFTRANDFGYSRSPDESFTFWNKEAVLSDVVYAIRKYQPDVIINRFPTTGEGGHGHHTASALLAVEAFHAAADPLRFPEQLTQVSTWKARRIFHNSFSPRGQQPAPDMSGQLQIDVGGYNTNQGTSYGEMAAASRSMHKSQGFGVAINRGKNIEYFKKLDGDTAVSDIFDGVNTNWSREATGPILQVSLRRVIAEFNDEHPEKSIPLLIDIRNQILQLEDGYWKQVKEKEVNQIIAACSGIWMEINSKSYYGVPGDSFAFTFSVIARTHPGVVLDKIKIIDWDSLPKTKLPVNEMITFTKYMKLNGNFPFSNPYWLNKPHPAGIYTVDDASMIGQPWNDPVPQATVELTIDSTRLLYKIPVIHKWTDPVKGERYRPYEIVPAVSISPSESIMLFPSGEKKSFRVEVKSYVKSISGTLKITAPEGWEVTPASAILSLQGKDSKAIADFSITRVGKNIDTTLASSFVNITFEENGNKYDQNIVRIEHDHIPQLIHLTKSVIKLVPLDLTTRVRKIGYIEGAGDDVAKCLRQAGFDVTILDEQKILKEPLNQYEAIITGIRAYNTIENIGVWYETLMRYVESGGNLVVQYNTINTISTVNSEIGPYPFKITRDRVTVEQAQVQFDDPQHFLLNTPNKITQADFNGWVQERGLYFAGDWSPEYKTIISMNDPGEKSLSGSVIIAQKGKGYFIYSGLSFFRQLPAGVPGAYRLLVNMLNAGK